MTTCYDLLKNHCIALTGGIASGKSTIADLIRKEGYAVCDADLFAKNLTTAGTAAIESIRQAFGNHVFEPTTGTLNRKALGRLIFSDADAKLKLESILHPLIDQELCHWAQSHIGTAKDSILFYEASLIYERNRQHLFKEVWVAYCPVAIAAERLKQRNKGHFDGETLNKIFANQWPPEKKRALAPFSIDTSLSQGETALQLKKKLKQLSGIRQ
jgi:dephospho-CoA kinase